MAIKIKIKYVFYVSSHISSAEEPHMAHDCSFGQNKIEHIIADNSSDSTVLNRGEILIGR